MTPPYPDRRQRRFRECDFPRGCRVKGVSQRKTAAVDHHHPLRPLAPLGFSDSAAPFFAGAKLPSRNDSLHFNCSRLFNSLRNVRQMSNQTSRSSQSRSRRQHVEGCGNFSGRSCQRAPLRRIHKIPSSTCRFWIHGRPPLRCLGGFGSKGAIFFHCASVSNGPHRAIGPPSALLTSLISYFQRFVHGCATASKKFGFSDWKIGEAGGEAHSTGTFGDGFYGMQTERRMALRPRQPTAENDISTRITNAIVKPSRVMARKGHSFSESRSGLFESRKRTGGNRSTGLY